MFQNVRSFVPATLLLFCLPAVARKADGGLAQVSVSVYDDANVPSPQLRDAESAAGRVLQEAGIRVTWINCESVSQPGQHCDRPGAADFSLRIVPHALNLSDSTFGVTFLDRDGSGRYADIFSSTAERLSEATHVNLGGVLGHVIAHELGHLLLGSNAHSQQGLMRPHWSSQELRSLAMGRLLFTPQQAQLMRDKLEETSRLARY